MPTPAATISATADLLAEKRFGQVRFDGIPAALRPNDLASAYNVQGLLVQKLLQWRGGETIGYKVACTSALAREQLNVPHPLFGRLLSATTWRSPATLPAAQFTTRTIEPEFGFQLSADVPPSPVPYTAASIIEFIGAAFPSIEIVDHRFFDWSLAGAHTVAADNAIHGAWVYGAPFAGWRQLDLAAHAIQLTVNGNVVREGTGAAVLDNPLNVMAWLANELPKFGRQLRRGDFVTTGVVCDVYPAVQGDELVADFGVMGKVELAFNAGAGTRLSF